MGVTKIAQYSLQLTFPHCEPLVCTTGGFTGGFTEGVLSAMISTIEPYRRVMSDVSQFNDAGNPFMGVANAYPAVYDFENRNKSCAGPLDSIQPTAPLVFLDDCITFCNPFGYQAVASVCDCV